MQNQARKMGQKNRKTKNEPPQSRKVGDTESQLGHWAKEVPVCPPARRQSIAEKTWLGLVLSLSGFQLGSKQQSVNITRENTSRH